MHSGGSGQKAELFKISSFIGVLILYYFDLGKNLFLLFGEFQS